MTCGERIRHHRERQGWSLRELARRTRIDVASLSRLESGDRPYPTVEQAKRLAHALGVTVDYLVGMYNDESERQPATVEPGATEPIHSGSVLFLTEQDGTV